MECNMSRYFGPWNWDGKKKLIQNDDVFCLYQPLYTFMEMLKYVSGRREIIPFWSDWRRSGAKERKGTESPISASIKPKTMGFGGRETPPKKKGRWIVGAGRMEILNRWIGIEYSKASCLFFQFFFFQTGVCFFGIKRGTHEEFDTLPYLTYSTSG